MKRTFPGRRRTLAVLCSTAVAVGIGGWTAGTAYATGSLTLSPSGGTEVTIVNTPNPVSTAAQAGTAYWFRTTDASGTVDERAQLVSGPTGGTVSYAEYNAIGAAAAADFTNTLAVPTTSAQVSNLLTTQNEYLALTADVPGDYVVRLYSDLVADGEFDSTQDVAAPTITVHVKDVVQNTAATTDDWRPAIGSPASIVKGDTLVSTVSFSGVTLSDARGMSSGTGNLALALQTATDVTVTDSTATGQTTTTSFSGSTLNAYTDTTVTGPTGNWTTAVAVNGGSTLSSSTTSVTDNLVSALTASAPDVTGSVADDGAGNVQVKPGVATVVYNAHIDTLSSGTDKSGKAVNFLLTPAVSTTVLTADGTLVKADSGSGAKLYRATSDSGGDAVLRVTSALTTDTTSYTVDVSSNGYAAGPGVLTTTYTTATPSSIEITSTASELTPVVGTAATVSGRLVDQYDAMIVPSPSMSQQVSLFISAPGAAPCSTPVGGAYSGADQNVSVSSGSFGFSYSPSPVAVAGNCSGFLIGYDIDKDGTYNGGDLEGHGTVNWASSSPAAAISLDGLDSNTTFPIPSGTTYAAETVPTGSGYALTATIKDGSSAGLPYAPYTLTATPGIYFVDPITGKYYATYSGVADASGQLSITAVTTKSGSDERIVLNSGAVTVDTGTFTVDPPIALQRFTAAADDSMGEPGQFVSVTGRVVDVFGNSVPNAPITITLAAGSFGSILGTPPTSTDGNGLYSFTYISGADDHGTVDYTVTATAGTPDDTNVGAYETASGLTLPTQQLTDTGMITIASPSLTLVAPWSKTGQGWIRIRGMTKPGLAVDVYTKPAGAASYTLVDTVVTHDDGIWTTLVYVNSTTLFLAKTSTLNSNIGRTLVYSKVRLGATTAGLPHGKVRLGMAGDPTHAGNATFVAKVRGHWRIIARVRTNSAGKKTWVWTVRPGRYEVVVQFTADGARQGSSPVGLVTVR